MNSAWLLCLLATQPQETPAPTEAFLEFEMAPIEAWMTAPKDAALLGALELFDTRLRELPNELDWHDVPAPMIELALSACSGSIHFAMGAAHESDAAVPMRAELRFGRESGTQAELLAEDVRQLFHMLELPLDAVAGSPLFESPVPFPVQTGAMTNEVLLRLGRRPVGARSLRGTLGNELLGEGAVVGMAGRADLGMMLDTIEDFAPESAEMDEAFDMLESLGIQRAVYEWAMGNDGQRALTNFRIRGVVEGMTASGLLPEARLTEKDLEAVPADATWANLSVFDAMDTFDLMRAMIASEGDVEELENAMAQMEGMLGVSLTEDILRPLGKKLWLYASETTGGGGLTSTVAVVELEDSQRFATAMEALARQVDGMGAGLAMGYVKVHDLQAENGRWMSLRFPGMPMPLEITMAITDGHVVAGLSPQAVQGALTQLAHGGDCLLEHPPFRSQVVGGFDGVTVVNWMNTPRLLRDGYGTMNMLATAISNAMRSPRDPMRGPAWVMPVFRDLAADALPTVTVTRIVGNDMLSQTTSDRSFLVNGTGAAGMLMRSPLSLIVGVGLASTLVVPRVTEELFMAEEVMVYEEPETVPASEGEHEQQDG